MRSTVSPKNSTRSAVLLVGGVDLDRVAPGPEGAADQVDVVAVVLQVDQPPQQAPAGRAPRPPAAQDPVAVLVGRAQAVDARHRGHHDHVAPHEQRRRGGVAQPVDLVVDRRVLLDVGVGGREVGLGLVVVVVGDEELDPVLGEELAQLRGELGGQGLVGLDDQGRALGRLDGPGDGGRLAAAGDALEGLVAVAPAHALGQGGDGRRLVAGRAEGGHDLEVGHLPMVPAPAARRTTAQAGRRAAALLGPAGRVARRARPTAASTSSSRWSRSRSCRPRSRPPPAARARETWAAMRASASARSIPRWSTSRSRATSDRAVDHHHHVETDGLAVGGGEQRDGQHHDVVAGGQGVAPIDHLDADGRVGDGVEVGQGLRVAEGQGGQRRAGRWSRRRPGCPGRSGPPAAGRPGRRGPPPPGPPTSASIRTAPRATSRSATADLPAPIPPVRPTASTLRRPVGGAAGAAGPRRRAPGWCRRPRRSRTSRRR